MRFHPEGAFSYLEGLEFEDYVLTAAVLLLPWAFGGVEIWAYRGAALLLATAAAAALFKRGWAGLGLDRGSRWLLPAALLAVWAVVQVVPLPAPVVKILSPRTHQIYTQAFPGYPGAPAEPLQELIEKDAVARAGDLAAGHGTQVESERVELGVGGRWRGWRPLSLHPHATIERLSWYVALLIGFLLARERARDPDRWRVFRTSILVTMFGLAGFALVQAATWNGNIFWIRPAPEMSLPFGPYVNFDHFAGVMELAVPWLAGYTWVKFRHPEGDTIWRSIAPVAAGATLVCLTAVVVAGSKTAAILVVVALTLTILTVIPGWKARLAAAGGALVVWTAAGLLATHSPVGERMQRFVDARGTESFLEVERVDAWRTSLEIIKDFPLAGVGFGAFRDVFPAYLPSGESERWLQLHNDYLEVIVDGGLIAGALVVWLSIGFGRRALRGVRPLRHGGRDIERLGLLAGILCLAAHAFVDFNHQVPANALLFVTAAALALAGTETAATAEQETP